MDYRNHMDYIISGFAIVICASINTHYIIRGNGDIRAKRSGTTENRELCKQGRGILTTYIE